MMLQWSYSSYGKPRDWSIWVPFLHGVAVTRTCSASAVGFSFSLVAGGKMKLCPEARSFAVLGFNWPKPPLLRCDCHTACAGTGRSFSLWYTPESFWKLVYHWGLSVTGVLEADDCKSHLCLRINGKILKNRQMAVAQSIQGHLGGKMDHCKGFRRG